MHSRAPGLRLGLPSVSITPPSPNDESPNKDDQSPTLTLYTIPSEKTNTHSRIQTPRSGWGSEKQVGFSPKKLAVLKRQNTPVCTEEAPFKKLGLSIDVQGVGSLRSVTSVDLGKWKRSHTTADRGTKAKVTTARIEEVEEDKTSK
jgi:hypothetical protein